jgi:hypothetical protein
MSTYIDKKYINMVSSLLEKFKWKKDNLANCRCPLCGDSDRSKIKARGYFYKKGNDFFYKCHNCGIGHNLHNFLEKVSLSLCKEYALERYRSGENGNSNYKKPEETQIYPFKTEIKFDKLENFESSNEKVLEFIADRQIPERSFCDIGYTSNFGDFAKQFQRDYDLANEERIIILIRDENGDIIGAQGRSLSKIPKKNIPKYITLRKTEDTKLIYGIDKLNQRKPFYIVEGPIDSMFIDNAIACLGSSGFIDMAKEYSKGIFILDNEPRNKQTVEILSELVKMGNKVLIWPQTCKEKDINEVIKKHGKQYMEAVLQNCVYSGLKAVLEFHSWKKCNV